MDTNDQKFTSEESAQENTSESDGASDYIKLDYTLGTPQERNELVKKIIENTSPDSLTPHYLEILSDYIIFAMEKEEKKSKLILTSNRLITVNKRETSYEGLCGKLENGEDGIYNMLSDLGKGTLLTLKDPITEQDVEEVPTLKELRLAIEKVEEQYKKARGKDKYLLKKQLIEMRQDQYVLRTGHRGTSFGKPSNTARSLAATDFYDDIYFNEKNIPVNKGPISFFNPLHIEALLCNYSDLRQTAYGNFEHDLWYMMEDLDNLIETTLKDDYPFYYDLLIYKIDGKTNIEIQELLEEKHHIKHTVEYLSCIWRKKIPKLLAESAENQYLKWYYSNIEKGRWKRCSRCGQIKLAHNRFFSKNKSSSDGYYSICKDCRNANSKKNQLKKIVNSH